LYQPLHFLDLIFVKVIKHIAIGLKIFLFPFQLAHESLLWGDAGWVAGEPNDIIWDFIETQETKTVSITVTFALLFCLLLEHV
jgi:hypothetical protein